MVAKRNVEYTREILKSIGISPERVQMFYCSAAEGQRFQMEVTRISNTIEKLGSNPFKESQKALNAKKSDSKKKIKSE